MDFKLSLKPCRYVIVRVYMGNWTVAAAAVDSFNARQIWKEFGPKDYLIWDNETETIADSLMAR